MRAGTLAKGLTFWMLFSTLYLLFAASLDLSELLAAAAFATLVLIPFAKLEKNYDMLLSIKLVWLFPLLKIPWATLQESWLLTVALYRQLTGRSTGGTFIEWHDCPEDRFAPGRRAFATFGVCITPNSYLVHIDHEKHLVLLRQLVGKEISDTDRNFLELP